MEQEFADTQGILIENISLFIRADMHPQDHHLVVDDPDKGLLDAAFSHPQGLHLRPGKGNPALEFIVDKVIKICFFIVRDQFNTVFPHDLSFITGPPAGNRWFLNTGPPKPPAPAPAGPAYIFARSSGP